MKVKRFIFNPIEVNCYVLSDETKECVVIDAGCWSESECKQLSDYIDKNELKVKHLLNTHLHFDHIYGNYFMKQTYGIETEAHSDDEFMLDANQLRRFGISDDTMPIAPICRYLRNSDSVLFGRECLDVLHVPGHSPGSVAFYCASANSVWVGDTLFFRSVGRTDLTGGNQDQLVNSIHEKLFTLPDDTIVYTGHGPATTIGEERQFNPYL